MLHGAWSAGSRVPVRLLPPILAVALLLADSLPFPAGSVCAAMSEAPRTSGQVSGASAKIPNQPPSAPGEPAPDSISIAIERGLAGIRRDPGSGAARIPLAEAYRSRGNLVAARATLEEALRLGLRGADSLRAVVVLADIAFKQGRPNEARTRLAVLALRSDAGPDLLATLAQMRWDDHQREEALVLGMESVAREPQNLERLRWVAERWKELGRPDEALALRKRILSLPGISDEDIFQVGFLAHQLGDGQTATDSYLRLLERRPSHPQGNYNLSLLMLTLGDTLNAAQHLELAIQGDPRMQRAYFDLAVLYMHSGRLADARRVLTQFQTAAGADSTLNAEVDGILKGIVGQGDRPRPRR